MLVLRSGHVLLQSIVAEQECLEPALASGSLFEWPLIVLRFTMFYFKECLHTAPPNNQNV